MRNLFILLMFFCVLPGVATAESGWKSYLGHKNGPYHVYKKFNPYLENGTDPHSYRFEQDEWDPAQWIEQRRSGLDLVRGFYNAEILHGQTKDNEVTPVLWVGPNFYHLGGRDKRRVVRTVDQVYGISAQNDQSVMLVRDWRTKKDIGTYTSQGLTLH